jgi:hypothetical protein
MGQISLTFPTEAAPASIPDLGAGTDEERWVRNKGLAPEGPPVGAEGGAWGPRSRLRHPLLLLASPPHAADWTYIHMVSIKTFVHGVEINIHGVPN